MEKINLTKLLKDHNIRIEDTPESWTEWALIELCSQRKGIDWVTKDEEGNVILTLDVKLDGKDVKFTDLIRRMFDVVHRSIEKAAKEQVAQKYQESMDKIEEATQLFLKRLGVSEEDLYIESEW